MWNDFISCVHTVEATKPYFDSSKANAVVHGVSQRSHSLDNFILCERILCDLEKFAVCTALINRISLVAGTSTLRPSMIVRDSFVGRRLSLDEWRVFFVQQNRERDMELTPNWIAGRYFPFHYFIVSRLISFGARRAQKKKPNELLSHQAKCVLMTSAHIQFAKKPKGSFRRFIRWDWSWMSRHYKHRWMDTWGPSPRAAHMYSKC